MPQSIGDVLSAIVSDVAANIATVTNFVDTIISAAIDVQSAAFRAIGLIKNAKSLLSSYRRQIGFITGDFSNLSSQISNPAGQFKDTYINTSFISNMSGSISDNTIELAKMQRIFEAIAITVPISRHRVIDGDTLQRIAVKFYGSADNWNKIYTHNKLQTPVLVIGSVLEIPRL
jgi:nucleoid-associated protein YgaU